MSVFNNKLIILAFILTPLKSTACPPEDHSELIKQMLLSRSEQLSRKLELEPLLPDLSQLKNKEVIFLDHPTGEILVDRLRIDNISSNHIQSTRIGDSVKIHAKSESADFILQKWNMLAADLTEDQMDSYLINFLSEVSRVLKNGGKIRIYPMTPNIYSGSIQDALEKVPGLKFETLQSKTAAGFQPYLVLRKKSSILFEPKLTHLTTRGIKDFKELNPFYLPPLEQMKGKVILDVGAGSDATLARELRQKGIKVYALDPKLKHTENPDQLKASVVKIPLPDDSVDTVLSAYSILSTVGLDSEKSHALVRAALKEISRVLRENGEVRVLSVHDTHFRQIYEPILKEFPELKIQKRPNIPFQEETPFILLRKRTPPHENKTRGFHLTSRWMEQIREEHPEFLPEISFLKGKKVLDIGSGHHADLVNDLRKQNIEAYGVDPNLSPMVANEYLKVGRLESLPFPDSSMDVMTHSWSVISSLYLPRSTPEIRLQWFKEIERVLKVGGEIRIYPIDPESIQKYLDPILKNFPNLKKMRIIPNPNWDKGFKPALIIRKMDPK